VEFHAPIFGLKMQEVVQKWSKTVPLLCMLTIEKKFQSGISLDIAVLVRWWFWGEDFKMMVVECWRWSVFYCVVVWSLSGL
jgi:hypothetical protein